MSPVGLSRLGEGLLLGRLDSGLHQERGSKKKNGHRRDEDSALAPAAACHLPGGARPPRARHMEDGSWGQRGTRAPSPECGGGTGGKSKSVQRPAGVAGSSAGERRLHRRRRRPAAHVSTTRMSGMGFGLGGLAILTLPRFSVVAQVWVLKLL